MASDKHTPGMRAAKPVYGNYEISGCWRIGDGSDSYVETCDDADAQFWTLYGHIDGQGVEAIGDFKSREAAEEVYSRITGQPFTGSYEADDRLRLMHAAPKLLEAARMAQATIDALSNDVDALRSRYGDYPGYDHGEACNNTWKTLDKVRDAIASAVPVGSSQAVPEPGHPSSITAAILDNPKAFLPEPGHGNDHGPNRGR